jgi:hypothetical protein
MLADGRAIAIVMLLFEIKDADGYMLFLSRLPDDERQPKWAHEQIRILISRVEYIYMLAAIH